MLTGTYFARDASYAHEYTDIKLTDTSTTQDSDDDVYTSGPSVAAAAAAAAADVVKKADRTESQVSSVVDESSGRLLLRVMVAARVYVGRYTAGHRTYRKPPPLDPAKPFSMIAFDSCVNYPDDPTLFVVFDSSQCYPEHFITYCCRSP